MADLLDRLRIGLAGRYTIERELGRGGMARVFLAEEQHPNRHVAIKVLDPEIAAVLGPERFLREVDLASKLTHPHILPIHAAGEADGLLYYVMPYVEGQTLRERLTREKQLPIDDALQITRAVADALSFAHSRDVIHRDIKPENILLQAGHAVVADFGISRAIDVAGGERLTDTGVTLGTPQYMSPEQAAGDKSLDGRSDLYSLGCVLYEMLAGQPPFTGATAESVIRQHLGAAPPDITGVRPVVPSAAASTLQRVLAKAPADRFGTAAEFREALHVGLAPTASRARAAARLRWGTAVLAVAIAATLGLTRWLLPKPSSGSNGAETRSLAVLPLENRSRDPEQDYFAAGMTEELITTLTKIEGLRVIAHRSVLQFQHSTQSVPEIARALDVKYLVDGSVLQDGGRVRITVSLTHAGTNTAVWRDSFERERRDVLALQREVALAIAGAIEIALTPRDTARLAEARPVDPEAFDLYVRGTQARYKLTADEFTEAADYFTRAIQKDSSYAPAHAGLASAHAFLGHKARALLHAEKALALDPTLAESHVVIGLMHQLYDLDWARAEEAFRHAIRLNPGYAEAHHELSMLLMRRRQFDDALREARLTLYLAPMSARFQHGLGEVYLFSSRYEEALDAANKALVLDSSLAVNYLLQGIAYGQQRRYEEAVGVLKRVVELGCGDCLAELGYVYAISGQRAEATEVVRTLKAQWVQGSEDAFASYGLGMVYVGLGDREQALEWLERAVEKGTNPDSWAPIYLAIHPALHSLHSEPRFQALLRRIGLSE